MLNIGINLDAKFHFKQSILNFMTKFAQKGYFRSKMKKVNITIQFAIFELISLTTKFQLKLTILLAWTKFCPRRVFPVENRQSEDHYWILHIGISLGTKSHFKQFWILGPNLPKKCFSSVEKEKSEHHHWILHTWISLGAKFQFELTILMFWTKFVQRGHFR